jgi:microcystin degradation protein MlrC
MRLFIAGMSTETNTFLPFPTGEMGFAGTLALGRVRALVGSEAVVGAELDLHCHTTQAMFANATCLVAYKEYPHTDIAARAIDLYHICSAAARREVRIVTGVYD